MKLYICKYSTLIYFVEYAFCDFLEFELCKILIFFSLYGSDLIVKLTRCSVLVVNRACVCVLGEPAVILHGQQG
jgi:hypothetical protein